MRHPVRTSALALVAGAALGTVVTVGTTRLVYAGSGFLAATGMLIALTFAALGAGVWGGDPALVQYTRPRLRAHALALAIIAAAAFAFLWRGAVDEQTLSAAGALAAMLMLAAPAYLAGSLFAALAVDDGPIAPIALAGAAIGLLLAVNTFVPLFEPWSALMLAGAVVGALAPLAPAYATSLKEGSMTGRVVIVTGAGDREQVGFAVAARLRHEGARLVVTARNPDVHERAAELGGPDAVVAVTADLSSDDDVASIVAAATEHFGRIDGLVNVAGGLSVIATIEQTSVEEWNAEYERNVETALRMTRAALPMLRASHGAIVSFASPAARQATASLGAYSAAKAGVVALTQALAIEEREHGVRANAIAPGMIDTGQNRRESADDQRFVTREQVADVVAFLLSPAGSGITGETIGVRGETVG